MDRIDALSVMYLRFALRNKHTHSPSQEGVFTLCYALSQGDRLESYEAEHVCRLLDWFERYLPAPECLESVDNKRVLCWFRCDAHSHLEVMWDLVAVLNARAVPVEFLKT